MMQRVLAMLAGIVLAVPAFAQEVAECDWRSSSAALIEPWEDYSRTFANGDVRIALLDTIEPGLAPLHVLVLSPPFDELGARQCRVISLEGTRGFADASFATLEAGYDPAVGLMFSMKVKVPEDGGFIELFLRFTLNQSTGAMEAWLE